MCSLKFNIFKGTLSVGGKSAKKYFIHINLRMDSRDQKASSGGGPEGVAGVVEDGGVRLGEVVCFVYLG